MDSDSIDEPVTSLPGIREASSDMGLKNFEICDQQNGANKETRKVGLRAEIDTSRPFESVKEAVTHFGGSGSWMPYYEVFMERDIKKVEEQAAKLEKDLIMKELETLNVLEELGTTKRIVGEFKLQLQKEALRCMTIIPEGHMKSRQQRMTSLKPCPTSSPDIVIKEFKQAKLNLGKTINDLGVIQSSIESLNKKMKKEKAFLRKTQERLMSKFAGVLSPEEELKQARVEPQISGNASNNYMTEQLKAMRAAEQMDILKAILATKYTETGLKTDELRLVAANKLEEAARAVEAVEQAEIKGLSSNKTLSGFAFPEPGKIGLFETGNILSPESSKPEGIVKKAEIARIRKCEFNLTKMSILGKMKEATEEVKQSKQALEEALNKVEMANRKQSAVEEAIRKWMPEIDQERQAAYNTTRFGNFQLHQSGNHQGGPLHETKESNVINNDPKPTLRSAVSMRDVLSRKPILPKAYAMERPTEVREERQKIALSQMLQELREDLTFNSRAEKPGGDQKQYTQRRKFGFIHISLPMTKPNKKKDARFL